MSLSTHLSIVKLKKFHSGELLTHGRSKDQKNFSAAKKVELGFFSILTSKNLSDGLEFFKRC